MITRILVPQAFENMEEATLGAWLKKEGDAVSRGDALCDLITEKTTFSLESEASGIVRRCVISEKSVVPVGTILALIGDEAEDLPDAESENAAILTRRATQTPAQNAPFAAPEIAVAAASTRGENAAPSAASRVRATPAARRVAKERGVSLDDVARAFPDKVLSENDMQNYTP
jgi:pyruvate dehydrogenase E2 component (dihydrolipoamide acetyltransferase)